MTAIYPADIRSLQLKQWTETCDRCNSCYLLTKKDDGARYYQRIAHDQQSTSHTVTDDQSEPQPTELELSLGQVRQQDDLYYLAGCVLAKGQGDYYDPYEGDSLAVSADELPQYNIKSGDRLCHECVGGLRQLQLLKRPLDISRFSSGGYIYREHQRSLVGVDYSNCAICDNNYQETNDTRVAIGASSHVPKQAVVISCGGSHTVYDQICFMPVKLLTATSGDAGQQAIINQTEASSSFAEGYIFLDTVVVDGIEHKTRIFGDIDMATARLGYIEYFTDLAAASDYLGCRYKLAIDNSVCDSCLERLWCQGRLLAIGYP